MDSTVGRPRKVTDEQVAIIKEWHQHRKSRVQLARELGISRATIQYVIDHNFAYKGPAPEERAVAVKARRTKLKSLKARGW